MTLTGSVANINAFIAGSNVTFTTALDATANVTLTVGIDDGGNTGAGGAQTNSTTATLAVSAVNDAPTITAPGSISVTEDVATALTGISFADVDAGGTSITVTLSVPSGALTATSAGGVTVAGSGTGSMTLTGSIANVNAFIAGSNVTFTTALNATSNVTLTVGIDDGGNTGSGGAQTNSTTVTLSVAAINDAPSITAPGSISVTEGVATSLTGISFADVDAGSAGVTVTLSVPSGALAATSGGGVTVAGSDTGSMTLSGSIANINTFIAGSNLTFTTALNATSNVTLTVDIDDGGNTGAGGTQTNSTTVTLAVSAVNDAPTIAAPGSIGVTEDIATALTGISFADVDAGSASVTVTLSVPSGTLAATSGGGVTVTGSGTGSMTLAGSIANINAFIAGSNVTFTTASNATSNVTLTAGINDGGNTGSGGAQSANTTVTLSVSAVNDAPTITAPASIAGGANVAIALTGISFADVDAGGSSVTATFSTTAGTMAATTGGGVTVAGSGTALVTLTGSIANINTFIAAGNLTFTGTASGAVTLTVGINDGGNSGSGGAQSAGTTVTLNVGLASQTITFGANPGPVLFAAGTFTVSATATSGLAVTFSSTTSGVCTVAGSTVTIVTIGTCTVAADQAGNGTYSAAPQVTQNITVNASVPGVPIIGIATPGNGQATIAFTPPVSNGGSAILSYTATCNPGGVFISGAASPLTVLGLTNGTTYTCSVTATNAAGTGAASATLSVTPLAQIFTGTTATGTGTATATVSGGGAACGFTPQGNGTMQSAFFIPLESHPKSPPAGSAPTGTIFPEGLFDFALVGCTPGSSVTLTLTYPELIRTPATYWKYGPTSADPAPHWYVIPATIAGNVVTFSITDGGLGDDDLAANGTIVDQGGVGVSAGLAEVPTLSTWALIMLAALLALVTLPMRRRHPR